jgi:predicted DNA-binding transcriptional regulator AlpA
MDRDDDDEVIDLARLASMLGLSPATILTLRSRDPERVPPAWRTRPLRWVRGEVSRWLRAQAEAEAARIATLGQPVSRSRIGGAR